MSTVAKIILLVGWIVMIYAGMRLVQEVPAQQAPSTAPTRQPASDGNASLALQRSVSIYQFQTTAERGPQRGEEIYYFKCWFCHNSYTVKVGTGAVPLEDLFERSRLATTGQPINDATVSEKIRNGGPGMPAYRDALSDADMADLLSYLHDETCCFEDEPPQNPAYRR